MALFPIVIILVFVCIWLAKRGSSLSKDCRWREDRAASSGDTLHFHCVACGAEMDVPKGKTPKKCLRGRTPA